uniref:Arp2/3 complex 34 kDa subunit n=1 Tax=Arundo donax TaxID=35708 RepID=A0A0A9BHA1_ARUDO
MQRSEGTNVMAFFNSGSRTLVEILTRMQSAERPMPVGHTFFESGSIRYHVEVSASDPENVYLSISTPSLSHEAPPSSSTGLPEITLQETRKVYQKFAEIIEPPKEGYVLTLKLNFSGLTRPKDRMKAINQVSRLQSVVLSSQLKGMLGSLGPSVTMKLVYNQRDPFFVSKTDGKINAIFPMRFRDDTDLVIAISFFQAGAAGPRELVREGAQVQLVADPAAGAARRVRAPPHHQRRLRVVRRFVAARPGEAGRQDRVDPSQLPGLRQVPHQVHPELHPEQDAGAAGGPDGGDPEREATGERRQEEIASSEEEEQEEAD